MQLAKINNNLEENGATDEEFNDISITEVLTKAIVIVPSSHVEEEKIINNDNDENEFNIEEEAVKDEEFISTIIDKIKATSIKSSSFTQISTVALSPTHLGSVLFKMIKENGFNYVNDKKEACMYKKITSNLVTFITKHFTDLEKLSTDTEEGYTSKLASSGGITLETALDNIINSEEYKEASINNNIEIIIPYAMANKGWIGIQRQHWAYLHIGRERSGKIQAKIIDGKPNELKIRVLFFLTLIIVKEIKDHIEQISYKRF